MKLMKPNANACVNVAYKAGFVLLFCSPNRNKTFLPGFKALLSSTCGGAPQAGNFLVCWRNGLWQRLSLGGGILGGFRRGRGAGVSGAARTKISKEMAILRQRGKGLTGVPQVKS